MKKDLADMKKEAGRLPPPDDGTAPVGADGKPLPDPFEGHWLTLSTEQLSDKPPKVNPLLSLWKDRHEQPVLLRGKAGILAAGGGTGKTQLLCQLALSVSLGADFLSFKVAAPGHVLLALGEEDAEEVQRRLWKAGNALGLSREQRAEAAQRLVVSPLAGVPVSLVESDGRGNVTDSPALLALRRRLEEANHDWSLLVLDPLSRWGGMDTEKDNAAATRLVQAVESLAFVKGKPTVLVAHHSSLASIQKGEPGVRGVTAIQDGFRWVATLTQAGNEGVLLANPKSNYTKRFDPIWLARETGEDARRDGKEGALRVASDDESKSFAEALKRDDGDKEAKLTRAKALLVSAQAKAAKAGLPQEPENYFEDKK